MILHDSLVWVWFCFVLFFYNVMPSLLRGLYGESQVIKSVVKVWFALYITRHFINASRGFSRKNEVESTCETDTRKAHFLAWPTPGFASIRPYFSERTSARLIAALITSRLDYCNSVLAGLPVEQIGRLQRVQNCAAQLVLKKTKARP